MKAQTPRGTRDFLGREMKVIRFILDKIRENFEKYGFEEAQTPAFENFDVLAAKGSGGEEIKEEIYYFKDKSNRELGLRFDFTVPLARMFVCNPNLAKPYKRYQIGQVWRYDRPGKGRYREFTQADADILGVKNPRADAELLALICDCMNSLGIENYVIIINSRKIAEGFVLNLGIKKNVSEVFRAMDKLEKIGLNGVEEELKKIGLEKNKIKEILEFIELKGKNKEILEKIKVRIKNGVGKKGIEEIERILNLAECYGIGDKIKFDLSLVRGLDYYTGFVLELKILEGNLELSCAGGGRYDNLMELYGGPKTPATGFSFGIDRLYDILKEKQKEEREGIFIALFDQNFEKEGIKLAQRLRKKGLKVSLNLLKRNLKNQISYASNKNFKYLIVLGEKELKEKKVKVKDLGTGKEKEVSMNKLEGYF